MQPYSDPLRPLLDALEDSVESFRSPESAWIPGSDRNFMDDLGLMLGRLEEHIEMTHVPPPVVEALPVPPAQPQLPLSVGPTSEGPPLVPEAPRLTRTELEPPLAARPYVTHEGLMPPSYRPSRGGSTGTRNPSGDRHVRRCPETSEYVDEEEACAACDRFGDHGAGFAQCFYDWMQENADRGREGDGDAESE